MTFSQFTELSLKTECLFLCSHGRPQMWSSCLSFSSSQNGRHPPPGLAPVFWFKIRDTVMFKFSLNCFYYCMFIRIYSCTGIHLPLLELFPKTSCFAKWCCRALLNQGVVYLPSFGMEYTLESCDCLHYKSGLKPGIGVRAWNPNIQKVRQEDCRLKTNLSYRHTARTCLEEYSREKYHSRISEEQKEHNRLPHCDSMWFREI